MRAASTLVVGADRAAVPERAEVLARIERERGGRSERARAAAAVARAVRLGGVLEKQQTVRLGERAEAVHVADLAVEMNRQDRRGARADRRPSRVRIDQSGSALDVAQHRRRPGVRDGERRCDERVSRERSPRRPGPIPMRPEHERERGGTRCHADAVRDLAVLGELRLELLDLRPERERARLEQPSERVLQLIRDRERAVGRARRSAPAVRVRRARYSDCLH